MTSTHLSICVALCNLAAMHDSSAFARGSPVMRARSALAPKISMTSRAPVELGTQFPALLLHAQNAFHFHSSVDRTHHHIIMMNGSRATVTALRSARVLYKTAGGSRRALVTCSSTLNGGKLKRWHSSSDGGDGATTDDEKEQQQPLPQIKAPRQRRRTRPFPVRSESLERLIGEPLQSPAGTVALDFLWRAR